MEVMAEELTRSFRVVAEIKDILPQKLSSDLHFVAYMNMYSHSQTTPHTHTFGEGKTANRGELQFLRKYI